jgi:hypothetical protein
MSNHGLGCTRCGGAHHELDDCKWPVIFTGLLA